MKSKIILIVVLTVLVVANVFAFWRIGALERELRQVQETAEEPEFELADAMAALQQYADKLYFAGLNHNWELAAFYLHEIEEKSEDVIRHNLVEDGIETGPLMQTLLLPVIEKLEESVKAKDLGAFVARYAALVANCNACHDTTKHGFIQITVPERSMFQNQSFAPRN